MDTNSTSDQDDCIAPESFYDTDCSLPGDLSESTSGEHCFLFKEHQAARVLILGKSITQLRQAGSSTSMPFWVHILRYYLR